MTFIEDKDKDIYNLNTIEILRKIQTTCLEKVKDEIIAQNKKKLHIQKPVTLEELTEDFGEKLPMRDYKKKPSYMDTKKKEYMISFFDDFKQSYKPLREIIKDNDIYKEMLLDIVTLNYEIYLLKYKNNELQNETNLLRQNLQNYQIKEMKQLCNNNLKNLYQFQRERKLKN